MRRIFLKDLFYASIKVPEYHNKKNRLVAVLKIVLGVGVG
jgi:hypothetical protein